MDTGRSLTNQLFSKSVTSHDGVFTWCAVQYLVFSLAVCTTLTLFRIVRLRTFSIHDLLQSIEQQNRIRNQDALSSSQPLFTSN